MEKETILNDFNGIFDALATTVGLYNDQNFNEIPFEGSWTPAQVTQHIILASKGFAGVLNAEVKDTERPIDEKIGALKSIFLNFGTKMKSPDFIKPSLQDYDREAHLSQLKNIQSDIDQAIRSLDLSKTCISFELPNMGFLTRLEAIYFVVFHTQRHTNQLNEIHQFLKLS